MAHTDAKFIIESLIKMFNEYSEQLAILNININENMEHFLMEIE